MKRNDTLIEQWIRGFSLSISFLYSFSLTAISIDDQDKALICLISLIINGHCIFEFHLIFTQGILKNQSSNFNHQVDDSIPSNEAILVFDDLDNDGLAKNEEGIDVVVEIRWLMM